MSPALTTPGLVSKLKSDVDESQDAAELEVEDETRRRELAAVAGVALVAAGNGALYTGSNGNEHQVSPWKIYGRSVQMANIRAGRSGWR